MNVPARSPPAGNDRGSISVVAAAVMVAMVMLALGCADVARTLTAASTAQTAADAAALAAAQELAIPGKESPREAAADFAARNGAELLSCACDPGSRDAVVEVRVAVGRLLLFGGDRVVSARARATVDVPG
jgi:secretion/DNA translocation related TadE-like protein